MNTSTRLKLVAKCRTLIAETEDLDDALSYAGEIAELLGVPVREVNIEIGRQHEIAQKERNA